MPFVFSKVDVHEPTIVSDNTVGLSFTIQVMHVTVQDNVCMKIVHFFYSSLYYTECPYLLYLHNYIPWLYCLNQVEILLVMLLYSISINSMLC